MSKIYVFVLDHDDNEKSMEITFTKDNPDGCKFVELFSKMNYSENSVRKFIEKNKELKSHVRDGDNCVSMGDNDFGVACICALKDIVICIFFNAISISSSE